MPRYIQRGSVSEGQYRPTRRDRMPHPNKTSPMLVPCPSDGNRSRAYKKTHFARNTERTTTRNNAINVQDVVANGQTFYHLDVRLLLLRRQRQPTPLRYLPHERRNVCRRSRPDVVVDGTAYPPSQHLDRREPLYVPAVFVAELLVGVAVHLQPLYRI